MLLLGKSQEKNITDQMKSDFRLFKKSRGYDISSILDEAIWLVTQIFGGKIMGNCRRDEVST